MPAPDVSAQHLELVRAASGRQASWAVWAGRRGRLSSDWLSDLSALDVRADDRALLALHRDVVLVAPASGPRSAGRRRLSWSAFHDPVDHTGAMAALADAVRGTPAWGSYLTPLFKHPPRVGRTARRTPDEVDAGVALLEDELAVLGGDPVLVCLGHDVGEIVGDRLGHRYVVKTTGPVTGPGDRARVHATLAGVLASPAAVAGRPA